MKFECPHCTQYIACDERHAGALIFCPKCEGQMIIPQPVAPKPENRLRIVTPSQTQQKGPPVEMSKLTCPYCSGDIEVPTKQLDDLVGLSVTCPTCKKKLKGAEDTSPDPEPEPEKPKLKPNAKKKVIRIARKKKAETAEV